MELRVTPHIMLERALTQMERHTSRLGKLQQQATTGKKLQVASDDPLATAPVLNAKEQITRLDGYLTNIQSTRSLLNLGVSSLQDASSILMQARNIALEASNSASAIETYPAFADQIDQLLTRLIDVTNTRHAGQYLFSGAEVQEAPFAVSAMNAEGRAAEVRYQGGARSVEALVAPRQAVVTNLSGAEIFQKRERGATLFSGETGAAAGAGTDNATGQGQLQVRHTLTTYAGASGVAAGSGSAQGDTILGPLGAHQLVINDQSGTGAFGTISLNGGPEVAFTSADSDLCVTGPGGAIVYVDTTAIAPGFSGSVGITAAGTLSVDGGDSTTAIDFSANQVVTHSGDGTMTNVNSQNIRGVGDEGIEYSGTFDVFQILIALRDNLRRVTPDNAGQELEIISNRIAELDRARNGVLASVGAMSVTLQNLDSLEEHTSNVQLHLHELLADREDADLSELVVRLQQQENLLQLTLAATTRIMDISILEFLR